ncbi:MAG: response regulator [Acidobacteria bacterium]|jgi:DNA-binding response OmpR family regulator|nr:response regulator [Acidobacteriota bacterium]
MLKEKKILIVEDEALIAFDLEDVVLSRGARASVCLDLETALAEAEAGEYDVAILDYNISGRTVLPVADTLQRKGIPFVFNTAMADFVNLSGRYEGAYVCRKPVNEKELVTALEELITTRPGGTPPEHAGA